VTRTSYGEVNRIAIECFVHIIGERCSLSCWQGQQTPHPPVNDRVENANGTMIDQVDGTSAHGGVINTCSMRGMLVVPLATPGDSLHPSRELERVS
jgi:hypothetical protein